MLLLISEGCRNPCPVFVSAVAHSFLGPWVGTHPCTHPFHYRVVVWCLPKRCLNGVLPCRSIPSPGRATACVSAGQLYLEARRLPVNQLSNAQICHLRFLWLLAKCSANTHTHTHTHTHAHTHLPCDMGQLAPCRRFGVNLREQMILFVCMSSWQRSHRPLCECTGERFHMWHSRKHTKCPRDVALILFPSHSSCCHSRFCQRRVSISVN